MTPDAALFHGQPAWRIATADVAAWVTKLGGHLAPVIFDRRKRRIMPYAIAPWAQEKLDPETPTVLRVLRGDFFCMPFGGNETPFRSERHPVHGETASATWKLESRDARSLHMSLKLKVRPGRVDKFIELRPGHPAVYCRHVISGMSGSMPLGHHAMLNPDVPAIISTSGFRFGQVLPTPFERPEAGGYQSLKPGARFTHLARIPTVFGTVADLTQYPARRGFEDLVSLISDDRAPFAWTAVTIPGQYAWIAMKDPRVLRQTVMWMSNGGRHYAPWNGRHVNVIGLEEVTSYFHYGLAESARANPFSRAGIATTLRLNPRRPLTVNYIMAAVPVPRGFDGVKEISPAKDGVELRSSSGKRVHVPLDLSFLNYA